MSHYESDGLTNHESEAPSAFAHCEEWTTTIWCTYCQDFGWLLGLTTASHFFGWDDQPGRVEPIWSGVLSPLMRLAHEWPLALQPWPDTQPHAGHATQVFAPQTCAAAAITCGKSVHCTGPSVVKRSMVSSKKCCFPLFAGWQCHWKHRLKIKQSNSH